MTIKIHEANDGKPPYEIIGGNVFYIYSNKIKKIFIYGDDDKISMFNCKCEKIIITYQPDEVLVYEEWDNSKDQYGNKIGEVQKFLNEKE